MKVEYSGYILGRRFNRKLFERVKNAIEQLHFNATATIDMSAKSQEPVIIVRGPQNADAADEIWNICKEYFNALEPLYLDNDRSDIELQDNW